MIPACHYRAKRSLWPISLLGTLLLGCVLPDKDIVLKGQYNAHAVRIVEPTYLNPRAREAICDYEKKEKCPEQLSIAPIPHHLSPETFSFCRCADPKHRDPNRLPSLSVLIEEADKDPIYIALLLDSSASQKEPAFWEYFSAFADPITPRGARPSLPPDPSLYWNPYHRSGGPLREIVLGNQHGIDLCNAHSRIQLSGGWHTLTVLVTDRPWFKPKDAKSPSYAIPDIAAGATFARTQYSFYCQVQNPQDPKSCHCDPAESKL